MIIVVAVLALLAGIAANHWLRPLLVDEDLSTMGVKDLVGPLLTLTVLLLSFTLVTASGSYNKGEVASRSEANALDHIVELADYAPRATQARIQADAVCYARAVRTQEWPAMGKGDSSRAPNAWSTDLRHAFAQVEGKPTFGMLDAADTQRSEQRQDRLAEATPSIPDPILWFLLITLAVTIIALGVCLPRRHNRGQIFALVAITALLTAALCLIRDVDDPFTGLTSVKPTALASVEHQAQRDYLADHSAAALPCDARGDRRAV